MAIVIIPLRTPPADEPNKCVAVRGECANDGSVGFRLCLVSFIRVVGYRHIFVDLVDYGGGVQASTLPSQTFALYSISIRFAVSV